jgi:hypothetical protein
VADRPGSGASARDPWHEIRARMDDCQAAYRRGWLRAPIGEPAHQPGGEELASDLNLACRLYLQGEEALQREIRHTFNEWTSVRGRVLAKAWSFADKLADTCDDRWLRLGLAAVSIDDSGTDFRDTYVTLGPFTSALSDAAWTRGLISKKPRRSPPASRTSNEPRCGISCSASKDQHTSGRPSHPS